MNFIIYKAYRVRDDKKFLKNQSPVYMQDEIYYQQYRLEAF